MNHRTLLLGSTGQVGWELHRSLSAIGNVNVATRNLIAADDASDLASLCSELRPTIIANAAAFTAVDKAETETEDARRMNSDLPRVLAELAVEHDAMLVDYSTDYVFDGKKEDCYVEDDPTNPINHYGATKLAGLQAILESGCRHLVFRVTWVYSARRTNFLKTILRLASDRSSLSVIDDQFGTPTPARWIAEMTTACLRSVDRGQGSEGIYHLTPSGDTTWFGFAQSILESAHSCSFPTQISASEIRPIATSEYPTPARRPKNSRLSKNKINDEFGFEIPPWESFVPLVVEEYLQDE